MQAWTRNSSVSSQALNHRATAPPFCCLKKMQCSFFNTVMRDKIAYTGLLVISFAACFFVFFAGFFTANYVDPASSGSSFELCHKIAAINVAFYINKMQRA